MSEPRRDESDHTTEDASLNQSSTPSEAADFLSDTTPYFETWFEKVRPALESNSDERPAAGHCPPAAQLKFEGTLWVDSYLAYLLRSQTGTLVVGEMGEVESDIVVAVAIIDGRVRGNIQATERVELQSHARVFGDIESPAVAIQPGAVFEGQCRFVSTVAT
jgi:hypothetical protein